MGVLLQVQSVNLATGTVLNTATNMLVLTTKTPLAVRKVKL